MLVLQCSERAHGIAGDALFIDPAQFGRQAGVVVDPPLAGDLGLGQGFGAAFGAAVAAAHVHVGRELAQHFGAVFLDIRVGVETADREPGVDIAPPSAGRPVEGRPAQLPEVRAGFDRTRVAFAGAGSGIGFGEAQTAIVGIEDRRAGRFGTALFELQIRAATGLQGQVQTLEHVIVAGAVLVDPGGTYGNMFAEPVLAAETGGEFVGVKTVGDVFVIDQQHLREAVERRIAGECGDVLAGDLRQRTGQQHAALELVDLVIRATGQIDAAFDPAGGAVAHFQHQTVRARQYVGVLEVVQAAAGAEEFAVPWRGLRFGAEQLQFAARFAQRGRAARAPRQRAAVQRTRVLAVFGARDPSVVVAPQRLVFVPVDADVQPALGIDIAIGRGVVAVDRIVGIRIETAEHVLRIGVPEALEQLGDFALLGVGLGGNQVFALDLALQIERQPAFDQEVVVVTLVAAQRLDRTGDIAAGQGEIGDGDREHVLAADVDVEHALQRRVVASAQLQLEAVTADRHQIFRDQLALQVDGMALAVDLDAIAFRKIAALDADARTVDRDVLLAQRVLAEDAFDQAALFGLLGAEREAAAAFHRLAQDLVAALDFIGRDQLHAPRVGFVHAAVGRVGTDEIQQFVAGAGFEARRQSAVPFDIAHRAHRQIDLGQRRHQIGVAGAVDQHFGALDEGRIVAERVEAHRFGDPAGVERQPRRRRDVELRLAEVGIFGRPDHAATRYVGGPAADGLHLARLLGLDRDPAIWLQRWRTVGIGGVPRLRLLLAAGAHPQQQAILRGAVVAAAIHLRGR